MNTLRRLGRIMGMMRGRWSTLWFAAAALMLGAAGARACTIPVFRYALERWAASPYEVVIFHHGDMAAEDAQFLEKLARKPANAQFRAVDVSQKLDPDDEALWKSQTAG